MLENLLKEFKNHFGENDKEIREYFAPSRINIIGEHIDYNGGKVFPCAIEIGTYALARKNDENSLRLKSLNIEKSGDLSLENIENNSENDWMNFPLGVAKFVQEEGYNIGGLDILIYGNIPNGSGLSSSASLEILIGEVFNDFYNDGKISRKELALIGKSTENKFIGVNSGIMDQFIIALGKKEHAMLLDTNNLEYEYYPFDLKDNKLVILNTNKRRELKDSKYNERRAESDKALEILREYKPSMKALCDIDESELDLLDKIEDPIIRKRATHAVKENHRVAKAAKALKDGDIELLGELLVQSNDSLRDLYEVTGPHLDSITKHANEFKDCLGARMTGAGFAGCGIAIIKEDSFDEFVEYVGKRYTEDTGLVAEFIQSGIDDGVRRL